MLLEALQLLKDEEPPLETDRHGDFMTSGALPGMLGILC